MEFAILIAMSTIHNFKDQKTQKGTFLVSSPFISNRSFKNSVIVILEYNESIVSAIKVNHNKKCNEDTCSYRLHDGGPIDQKRIILLHSCDKRAENTTQLTSDILVTDLEETSNFYPEKYYAVSGYISWIYDDFLKEIKNSEWIPINASSDLIFDIPVVQRWHMAYNKSGIRPEFIQRSSFI